MVCGQFFHSGTPAKTSFSLFLEPALTPSFEDDDEEDTADQPQQVQPLYVAMRNCSSLSLSQKRGLQRTSCIVQLLLGRPLECVSTVPAWYVTTEIDHKFRILLFFRLTMLLTCFELSPFQFVRGNLID